MAAKVYFADLRARANNTLLMKTGRLVERTGFPGLIREGDQVAVKLHWGEWGNVAFLPPPFVRCVVDLIIRAGGKPFLTDTNTLYTGQRRNAIDNILTALKNGFSLASAGAPIIVADGLDGHDTVEVPVNGTRVKKAKIASGIHHADTLISLAHFKGHELFGFGGALKNIAMGCATPAGKQVLHSDVKPRVDSGKCSGCGTCVSACSVKAISLGRDKKALIRGEICIGCAECTAACPAHAIPINWETASRPLMEKSAEYAKAALANKGGRAGFVNFLINISPECDCYDWNDAPFVGDQGILASLDPVALDQASADLVNRAQILSTSRLGGKGSIKDPIAAATGIADWSILLEYAEKIGLGTRKYELINVE
ncbi:MAG: DUF362 domain-containing protein [Candidatus Aureabacteria bacterium]|nr:DUF362 domain-containing protein [Candidatus Auribacterota bacterium]